MEEATADGQNGAAGGVLRVRDKTRYDAFHGTQLEAELLQRGIRTVAISGVLTNMCCETTARAAFVRDFDVIFLADANATTFHEAHRASLRNLVRAHTASRASTERIRRG